MTTISKYSRDNFYGTMTNNDNEVLTDPLQYDFEEFIEFMRDKDVRVVRLSESNERLPDAISYFEYGSSEFWWVICYVNRIQDPLNELDAGLEIAIPFIRDIEEFKQSQNSSQTRGETVILR